jgi:hypothetical protein
MGVSELEYIIGHVEGIVNGEVTMSLTVYADQEDRNDVEEQYSTNRHRRSAISTLHRHEHSKLTSRRQP